MVNRLEQNRFYVYTYSYPNGGVFYVGKGCGRRMNVHLCDAKAGRRQRSFVVRVVGKLLAAGEAPIIQKILSDVDNELACLVESELIAKHGRRDIGTGVLANCTDGGDEGAPNLSPEAIKQRTEKHVAWMRANQQLLSNNTRGEKNPFYGKRHTPEALKKIGEASQGRAIPSYEHVRRALSAAHTGAGNPMFGKKHSEKTKAKFKNRTPNSFWTGKTMADEHKLRLSVSHKARPSLECPHCGKVGGNAGMKAHHFDHCKKKEAPCQ
jgi:hypothetical protein